MPMLIKGNWLYKNIILEMKKNKIPKIFEFVWKIEYKFVMRFTIFSLRKCNIS